MEHRNRTRSLVQVVVEVECPNFAKKKGKSPTPSVKDNKKRKQNKKLTDREVVKDVLDYLIDKLIAS